MIDFLKRLWRWLVARFTGKQVQQSNTVTENPASITKQLPSDAEYEQIFMQLLEQVAKGTTPGKIKGFLFSKNISEAELIGWLEGFGERILASSVENHELAMRLMHLGEVAEGKLARVAKSIGEGLVNRGSNIDSQEIEIRETTENQDLTRQNAEKYFKQGNELFNLGKYESAILSYDKAIQFQPDFSGAWCNRGIALGNLGKYESAILSFDKAIQFQPDFSGAWYNRGNALDNLGKYESAILSIVSKRGSNYRS